METNNDLIQLANNMRENATASGKFDEPIKVENNPSTVAETVTIDDDPVVIGGDHIPVKPSEGNMGGEIKVEPSNPSSSEITLEDLQATMPEVPEEYLQKVGMKHVTELNQYMRNLIIEYGITPEEAYKAAKSRTKNIGEEIQKEWLKNNPKLAIVEIKKTDSNVVEFTKEEHAKLEKARAIRLVEVEDKALKTISIKVADRDLKTQYINEARLSLTRDSVPLVGLSDYVAFNGIQILTIYSSIMLADDSIHESISRKARVVYDAMEGGMHYKKYDSSRKVILSFEEFLNTFPYYDLDMALFSCLCASSPETTTAEFGCRRCGTRFKSSYNVRKLINFNGTSEEMKKRIDDTLENRKNVDLLLAMQSPLVKGKRVKSDGSGIIYDLKIPSIAKALSILQYIDRHDERNMESELGLFASVVFIDTIHLPVENGDYVDYSAEEADLFWDIAHKLPQEDLDAINLLTQKDGRVIAINYELDLECSNPQCKSPLHNLFNIDQLIFQRAQDTPVETTLSEN